MKVRKSEQLKSLISVRPTGTRNHFWATFAWCAVILVAVAYASSCGSGTPAGSEQQSPTAPGDLRFQQVGAPSQANQGLPGAGEVASNVVAGSRSWWTNYTGTPLELAFDNCNPGTVSPYACAWAYSVTRLPSGQSGLAVSYQGGFYSNLASDLASISTSNTVITSLDLQPANGAYAAAWISAADEGGYDLEREVVPLDQVQSVVAEAGEQSRVITAVSFDASGQANLLSYGWSDDTVTVYQTNVVNVAGKDVATAATNLAGEGYIITGFGGNTTQGYVLIGTKVWGDMLPRPILVATQSNTPWPTGTAAGYAIVGFVNYGVNITATGYAQPLYTVIYEK